MLADDLLLICETPEELQSALKNFLKYCEENSLTLNAIKTKVLVFHKGKMLKHTCIAGPKQLEILNSFKYLGFNLSCQPSFSAHAEYLNIEARSRIGHLLARLPIRQLPLNIVLQIWRICILPFYRSGLLMWLATCSKSMLKEIDTVFLKYIKLYLEVPRHANNAITYFITQKEPFSKTLMKLAPHCLGGLSFPEELHGIDLDILNMRYQCTYDVYREMPTWFWRSRTFFAIPKNSHYRRKLCLQLFDLSHKDYCITKELS